MNTKTLALYTIYHDPDDYPGLYVVRRFDVAPGLPHARKAAEPHFVCTTLQAARKSVPPEADERIGRDPSDAPSIVETWI